MTSESGGEKRKGGRAKHHQTSKLKINKIAIKNSFTFICDFDLIENQGEM